MPHDQTLIAWSHARLRSATGTPTDQAARLDSAIARATGVFWRNDASGLGAMTQDYIQRADGTSPHVSVFPKTSMPDSGPTPTTRAATGSPDRLIGFGISVTLKTGAIPVPNQTKPTGAFGLNYTGPTSNTYCLWALPTTTSPGTFALTDGTTARPRPDADINSNLQNATNGATARPRSNHPDIALFCFADGHALPLSQNIDIGVYMRAISPAGSLFGQTVDGDVK